MVAVESLGCPEIGRGEVVIRVETCGVCHTDLKKIEYDLLTPPRIYGHETAGVIAAVGPGVTAYAPGDRVIVFHHIPCGRCFYCSKRLYAQCATYKKVGRDGWIRTGRGRVRAVCASDGLDRSSAASKRFRGRFVRSGVLRRAGEYLRQGDASAGAASVRRDRDSRGKGPSA